MKIIVTGAAGAIGSHLCERLLSLGHEVVGIDALTPYYNPEIKKINAADVELAGGKINFIDLVTGDLGEVLQDAEVIFHLAAQPGISATTPFKDYLNNNIIATHRLLEQAKSLATLKAFIHASTSSVYGAYANGPETSEPKPTSNYGVTKLAAEQLALSYERDKGLPVTVLRFFSVYGERERPEKLYHKLIRSILNNEEFTIYEGARDHIRSYTYISDIIDGCILVLNNFEKANGEIFNLGNDKTMTTGEGIDIIEELVGKQAKFKVLPKRSGDQKETAADIDKMKKTFGYQPIIGLKEGLKREVEWYKEKILNKLNPCE
jgi:UDP-glucuronate 4-epimerase